MQTISKTSVAERIVNIVWGFIKDVKSNYSIYDIFTSTLTVLYAYHKGYDISDKYHLKFTYNDDCLYQELINLIPNDRHLHFAICQLVDKLSQISCDEFNSVYIEILRGLFSLVSSNSGKETGDFYTPSEITKLMAYIVNKSECKSVFDPFCGTASIVHELSRSENLPVFYGQELNYKTSIYARLNIEALYGTDGYIANINSIMQWDNYNYDAVVSCPPIGLRLTQGDLCEAQQITPHCSCRSYEEIILYRPFYCNNAKLTVTLLSTGFCFRGNRDYELRRDLVERNLVDMIISLPTNILYGTSIPSVILVCKRGRNHDEPIKFINAEDYFLGERRKRTFDYERFVKTYEGDACDVIKVTPDEVAKYDFDLNPLLYVNQNIDLKVGQTIAQLGDIVTIPRLKRAINGEKGVIFKVSDLSNDWSSPQIQAESLSKESVPRGYFCLDRDAILVSLVRTLKPSIIKASKKEPVWFSPKILAIVPSETIDAEYLCMKLAEMEIKTIGIGVPQNYLLRQKLVCPELPIQKDLFAESARARTLAKAEELGLQELVKQMKADYINEVRTRKHDMRPYLRELGSVERLMRKYVSECNKDSEYQQKMFTLLNQYHVALNHLSDLVDIFSEEEQFGKSESFNIDQYFAELMKSHNHEETCFKISYERDENALNEAGLLNNQIAGKEFSILNGLVSFKYETYKHLDSVPLYVDIAPIDFERLVRNIIENAHIHGFTNPSEKFYELLISLSIDSKREMYQIDFINNGTPLPSGINKKRYGIRGEKAGITGGTGRGGYIVKSIVEHYNGDYDIFMDEEKTVVRIYLPISKANDE